MKLEKLQMMNFRSFENLEIDLNENCIVFVGANGSGKTSVLDAIAIVLSTYISSYDGIYGTNISKNDTRLFTYESGSSIQREPIFPTKIECTGIVDHEKKKWSRSLEKVNGRTKVKEATEIIDYAKNNEKRIKAGDNAVVLPIISYYGTGRLWNHSVYNSMKAEFNRTSGYLNCLSATSDEKRMLKWFEKMTYIELQSNKKIPELQAVFKAMSTCYKAAFKDVKDVQIYFDVKAQELEVIIVKQDKSESLPMKNLSDGVRNALSLVADIAYRMAVLNPALLDDILKTPGIVLIDEIDMHLHPEWQKSILHDITSVFPNVQFITTTHSPSVLANVNKECVRIITQNSASIPIQNTYGRNITDILNEIMESEVRPSSILSQLKRFHELLDSGQLEEAKSLLTELEDILGKHDNDIIQAKVAMELEEL